MVGVKKSPYLFSPTTIAFYSVQSATLYLHPSVYTVLLLRPQLMRTIFQGKLKREQVTWKIYFRAKLIKFLFFVLPLLLRYLSFFSTNNRVIYYPKINRLLLQILLVLHLVLILLPQFSQRKWHLIPIQVLR